MGPYVPDRWALAYLCWMVVLAPLGAFHAGLWPEEEPMPVPTYHIDAKLSEADSQALGVAGMLRSHRIPCNGEACASGADVLRIARVIVEESAEVGADPLLVASIVTVEDPWLDTTVVSHAGAVGLMQIMEHLWQGVYATECGGDLRRVRDNVCTGIRIAESYGVLDGDPEDGLLRYNGCRPGWGCAWYADSVKARADR